MAHPLLLDSLVRLQGQQTKAGGPAGWTHANWGDSGEPQLSASTTPPSSLFHLAPLPPIATTNSAGEA